MLLLWVMSYGSSAGPIGFVASWRDVGASSPSQDDFIRFGLLWSWFASRSTIPLGVFLIMMFVAWSSSGGHTLHDQPRRCPSGRRGHLPLGWLLVPTIVILNFFYSEARSFASYFIALAHVPQTYGRTYIELDELDERRSPAWKFRTTETVSDQVKNKALVSSHHKSGANEA